ncbi:MAG: peptidoglycan-associated lipoprotein [Deltaproteobacteria bacterium RIFCSPHIGHO2_02_FULL_40_11]|nr:MAG: peptidoglycan-associated lipoprotein [Deltaproteobacteria bacterium RIFCSPHIGHO2_02_FULL_40_11]
MKKLLMITMILGLLGTTFVFEGCAKKQIKTEEPKKGKALEEKDYPMSDKTAGMNNRAGVIDVGYAGGLRVVLFEFDDSNLTEDARALLKINADWLKENQKVQVQIEGHCDSRGTQQYNLALGQKRADSVKRYLVNLGVQGGRLSTLSYGEDRPFESHETEEAWAKNRRAEFVITDL